MQPDQNKAWSECRRIGGNSDITAESEAESSARTGSIHGGNHRFRQRSHAPRDHLPLGENRAKSLFVLVFAQLLQLLNVTAGRKAAAFTGYDDDASVVISRDPIQRVENLVAHWPAERVELFGTIQSNCRNRPIYSEDDRLIHVRRSTARRVRNLHFADLLVLDLDGKVKHSLDSLTSFLLKLRRSRIFGEHVTAEVNMPLLVRLDLGAVQVRRLVVTRGLAELDELLV